MIASNFPVLQMKAISISKTILLHENFSKNEDT